MISDNLIDSLTPDIITLYNDIFAETNNFKNLNLLTQHNIKNIYYIPLNFLFLQKTAGYIPLHLLYDETVHIKVFFNQTLQTRVIAHNINLIANYYILRQDDKKKIQMSTLNLDDELRELVKFETNKQLNIFSKIYFEKIRSKLNINE